MDNISTILIIIFIILILYLTCSKNEHLTTTDETVQNIASMYNNGNVITTNLTSTGDTTVGGNLTTSKNLTVDGSATVNGNATIDGSTNINGPATITGGITTNSITPTGTLALGSTSQHLLLLQKIYTVDGYAPQGGDLYSGSYQDLEHATMICKGDPRCSSVFSNGGNYWMKYANNSDWLIGSPEWTEHVYFTMYLNGTPASQTSATSFSDCYNKATTGKYDYFNFLTNNSGTNCNFFNKTDNGNTTIFVKKY